VKTTFKDWAQSKGLKICMSQGQGTKGLFKKQKLKVKYILNFLTETVKKN
jgi:hypothetical protein